MESEVSRYERVGSYFSFLIIKNVGKCWELLAVLLEAMLTALVASLDAR